MTRMRVALLVTWLGCFNVALVSGGYADVVVYDDALAPGWQDWSWGGVARDFSSASPVHSGTYAIAVTYTAGWSGLQLGDWQPLDVSAYDTLRLYVRGGTVGGQVVQVSVGNNNTAKSYRALADEILAYAQAT